MKQSSSIDPRPVLARLWDPRRAVVRRIEDATLYRPITLLYMAAMAAMLVPLLTLADMAISRYFATKPLPSELASAIELTLVFSHGTGVFFILAAMMLMAPKRRWHVPRLAALALGGGALATIVKMFVLRPRPLEFPLEHAGHDVAWIWAFDWTLDQIAVFEPNSRSFPSAHVATATALTIGLWITLPRGRILFALVWAGLCVQRVHSGTHFLSDICGGVSLGLLWSFVCYCPFILGNVFDKMIPERKRKRVFDSSADRPPQSSFATQEQRRDRAA